MDEKAMMANVELLASMLPTMTGPALSCAVAMRARHEALPIGVHAALERVEVAAATLVVCGLAEGDMPTARSVLQRARLQVLDEDGGEA